MEYSTAKEMLLNMFDASTAGDDSLKEALEVILENNEGGGGSGGSSVGVLYALSSELAATTDPSIPEGVTDAVNTAKPLGATPDAETPMTYSELAEFFEAHDIVFVDMSIDGRGTELARFVSGGVMETDSTSYLVASVIVTAFIDFTWNMMGVFFSWSNEESD